MSLPYGTWWCPALRSRIRSANGAVPCRLTRKTGEILKEVHCPMAALEINVRT